MLHTCLIGKVKPRNSNFNISFGPKKIRALQKVAGRRGFTPHIGVIKNPQKMRQISPPAMAPQNIHTKGVRKLYFMEQ